MHEIQIHIFDLKSFERVVQRLLNRLWIVAIVPQPKRRCYDQRLSSFTSSYSRGSYFVVMKI